ncbi:MAG: phytoene desaturase family protein [Candidatus Phaeomarinobacter sp.]
MSGRSNSFDVAIVGGGHNGLVAAGLLAKAGRRVVLCEALPTLGSACGTSTLVPGVRVPKCAHVVSGFPPSLIRQLKLKKYGLHVLQKNVGRVALDPDGRHIPLCASAGATREAIFSWSSRDADAWSGFSKTMDALVRALRPVYAESAPKLIPDNLRGRLEWLRHYVGERKRGASSFQKVLRLLPSNAADFLDDSFETDLLKGALSLDASIGSFHGPYSPGSLFYWAWQRAGETASASGTLQVAGGPGGLTAALTKAAEAYGAELKTSAPVQSITAKDGQIRGLVLQNGDEVSCPIVISTVDPKATYLQLLGPRNLDAGLVGDVNRIRMRGSSAKVNLALERIPTFPKADESPLAGRLLLAPSLLDVERASNSQKYGILPDHPVMEVTLPSIMDETLTPEGRHVLSVVIPFMPFDLDRGWDAGGDILVDKVVKTLGEYSPDLPDLVMAGEVLVPPDIESHCGVARADWHQGELTLDQSMMMRPTPQLAEEAGSIKGLFLGGAGAHPGGGLTGRPALHAVAAAVRFSKETRL